MPIITKPSEALKLALKVMDMPEAPWERYNHSTIRGSHHYTCNCLDYLEQAEEITKQAQEAALEALWPNSIQAKRYPHKRHRDLLFAPWFTTELGYDDKEARIAAINLTIQQLEEKGQ